jgi:glucose/arabinose dehydrogenase
MATQVVGAQAPADFSNTLLASVPAPTALAFTPDGRLLIASQVGRLYVYQNGSLVSQPALDMPVCTNSERGLLGVAVDPSFASNGFVYVFYTFNKFGGSFCEVSGSNTPVNRVSRFTLTAANQINRASEVVLIDNMPSYAGNHNAGDVQFGRDGYLYVSIGDSGCDYTGSGNCAGGNDAARDSHVLVGKILRIAPDGSIPPTNPYRGTDSARCNVTGRTDPGKKCQETFASGLRNPFRMAFDSNASGTRFFINDVGQDRWEEINLGQAGADYGWNIREGMCANNSTTDCSTPPAGLTNPIHAYGRTTGCSAITGGAFVPNGVWPSTYDNAYLFADYTCGTIFKLSFDGTNYVRTTFVTGLGSSSATAMTFGPFNGAQALYYTTYAGGGQVRRIAYTGSTNRPPTASMTANPTSGTLPLTVAFDGRGSSDPDGGALTYDWNFGDGTAHATTSTVSHVYSTAGLYTATLTVRDPQGATGTTSRVIDAGNRPPALTITSPLTSTRFRVNDTITLQAQASDPEDGPLPASALTWTVQRVHAAHTHPFLQPTAGNGLTFQAPPPEDFSAASNSYLQILVTATDSRGLTTSLAQDLLPRLVNLTFVTNPAGLHVDINGSPIVGPQTVVSWDGYALTANAPSQNDASGQPWVFQTWSDGGAAQHTIVTPSSAATFTTTFALGTPAPPGLVAAYNFNEGSGTVATDASGNGNNGTITGAAWNTGGKYGQALSFDGVNDWVTINDSAGLDLTSGMTLEAWVWPTSQSGWETVIFKEMAGDHAYVLYSYTDNATGRPTATIRRAAGSSTASGSAVIPVNAWTHLAATYDGAMLRFYVNGALTGSTAATGAIVTTTGALRIGGNNIWAEWFNGLIDDVRVYNRALSLAEIQADMNRAVGSQAPAPPTNVRIIR